MLKKFLYIILCVSLANTSFARSNADIGRQLYSIANEVLRVNPVRGEEMKSDIASFLIDINMKTKQFGVNFHLVGIMTLHQFSIYI